MNEEEVMGIVWKCSLCGFCPKDIECPAFDDDARWESSYARGKVAIVHGMIKNPHLGFQNSELAKQQLFSCTGCGHCLYICPSGVKVPEIINTGKKILVDAKNYPEPHVDIIENIKKQKNPFGEPTPRDQQWEDLKDNFNAETVYFPGCMAIYRNPEIAFNSIKLFKILGEEIKVLKNETCCSGILYRIGHTNLLAEVLKPMLDELHENPPKQIIFTCPGCLTSFKEIFRSLLGERFTGTKLLHFTQYLLNKISKFKEIELKVDVFLSAKVKQPIIWHDPCHLARDLDIFAEPRAILNELKIPYLEFKQNRHDSNCCGSGSGVRAAFPEFAERNTLKRLEEIKKLGAKTILTACPFCEYQYLTVADKHNLEIEVLDFNILLMRLLQSGK
ncbi:MAG: (Fe-S)-binding protein [Promethearchaeota archaeon]|jgi:Fe-S oxidoreductase